MNFATVRYFTCAKLSDKRGIKMESFNLRFRSQENRLLISLSFLENCLRARVLRKSHIEIKLRNYRIEKLLRQNWGTLCASHASVLKLYFMQMKINELIEKYPCNILMPTTWKSHNQIPLEQISISCALDRCTMVTTTRRLFC